MDYQEVCQVYRDLEKTSKGLEKTTILAKFLAKIKTEPELIYLIQGRVFPDYDEREFGISEQLAIKAISKSTGFNESRVVSEFKKLGDLGLSAEKIMQDKRQSTLFSKKITTDKVLANLRKLPELEGKGTVEHKLNLIIELLNSASPEEAKYLVRTLLADMKVGVGSGILRDAIVELVYQPKDITEKKEKALQIQEAYDKATDFAEVFEKAILNKLGEISLNPGKPVKVMLYPKAENIEDAFKIVGRPAAFEFKYDGFRMMLNKQENKDITIFTRRLDNVTNQFPDAVKYASENISGKTFIIDCEAVGFDPKTKKYRPFQDISQRIKRKYEIEKLEKELPIELKIFDIIYYNGKSLINEPFKKRRELIEKIVKSISYKIQLAEQLITGDEKQAEEFYDRALDEGQEGLMAKSLQAPYKPGARIGYAVKIKPEGEDFDLVITGAEYGTGKRAGWLTSFDVACNSDGELLDIGKVSTGLKEKPEEGLSFLELTKLLKKIIIKEDGRHVFVKPEIVLTVQYQNIQKSPSYSSGYALRFPRVRALRPDRGIQDIATLKEVEKEARKEL